MYKIIGADGKEYGPVNAQQLRQWIAEGRVNARTQVLAEGSGEWRPLGDFPEFAAELPGPPPPLQTPAAPSPAAASLVNGPATGLIVVAVLNFISALAGLVFNVAGDSIFSRSQLPEEVAAMFSGALSMASNVLGLLMSGLILFGGLKMRKLESYGLVMTASILAALPCTSPCCVVGLPIGIWAIVMLTKPEVKSAFAS